MVIHGNILYRECRQIFKHKLIVAVKQVFAIKQQGFHEFTIDIYPPVLAEFHSRHLLDYGIQ